MLMLHTEWKQALPQLRSSDSKVARNDSQHPPPYTCQSSFSMVEPGGGTCYICVKITIYFILFRKFHGGSHDSTWCQDGTHQQSNIKHGFETFSLHTKYRYLQIGFKIYIWSTHLVYFNHNSPWQYNKYICSQYCVFIVVCSLALDLDSDVNTSLTF